MFEQLFSITVLIVAAQQHTVTCFVTPQYNNNVAFSATSSSKLLLQHYHQQQQRTPSSSALFSENNDKDSKMDKILDDAAKTKGRVDAETRKKLLAESIAPWRSLRLFMYGSLGSGAALGGFICLTGILAAKAGTREVDFDTEYLNLAIDWGAVAFFAICAKFDLDKKEELDVNVEAKLERKKSQNKIAKTMKTREQDLGRLTVQVKVSPDPDAPAQIATIGAVQAGANQHVIVVIGPKKAIKDALLGANLLKLDFSMSNVLVVPYEINKADASTKPTGSGFGERPLWETQAYVAEPVGDGWENYVEAELQDAVVQSGPMVKQEGVAIVLANDGKVIRRGVGKVPWRQMVDELEQTNAVVEREKEYGLL